MTNSIDWKIKTDEQHLVKQLLDSFPHEVIVVDLNKQIIWANQVALNNHGQIEGLKCFDCFCQNNTVCINCHMDEVLESKSFVQALRIHTQDNEEIISENWSIPIVNPMLEVESVLLIRRLLPQYYEDELLIDWRTKEEIELGVTLEHLLSSRKLFHDIRNPLNGLYGVIQLLKDSDFPEVQKDLFNILTASYEQLITLIENTEKTNSQIKSESQLISETFSIRKMMTAVLEPYKNRASRKELFLKYSSSSLEFDQIETDRYRLIQFLSLLISNMINFIYRGIIDVSIKPISHGRRQGLTVSIRGNGIIQRPHFDNNRTQITGLSMSESELSVFNQLVEILKIREFHVETHDEVLKYSFWLPVLVFMNGSIEEDVKSIEPPVPTLSKGNEKYKLLIVEDDFLSRMTYQLSLSKQYDLIFAKNGLECIALYMKKKPDLVIVDIMLPDISGFEVYERIEGFDRDHPPLIACTAQVIDTEASYLKSFGFKDYLPKPIQNKDLKAILEHYLK